MQKNTPELWDNIWNAHKSEADDHLSLENARNEIRWVRIKKIVEERLGGFNGLRTIEIGAGTGTYSALMHMEGAEVTIADYSDKALQRARDFFAHNGLHGEFMHIDALNLPDNLLGKFDIAMSFGLTEHFLEPNRFNINKAHIDLIKPGGLVFISVPNAHNPFYRIYKYIAEKTGRWTVGEEYPYSRNELTEICKRMRVDNHWFIGDSLITSLSFLNHSARILKNVTINTIAKMPVGWKLVRLLSSNAPQPSRGSDKQVDTQRPARMEKGTRLDEYFSYALVLCAQKEGEASR